MRGEFIAGMREMADYSETLNLPKTDFPMRGNLPEREPEFQRYWQEINLYQKILQKEAPKGLFVLHDGPPYANGDIHLGHAVNKSLKDFIVRFRTMQGYRAPYIPGWDCHGMPIEVQVTKEFHRHRKSPTKQELRRRCREYAHHYINVQREQFKRLGVTGDWDHPYITMSKEFEAKIVQVFGEIVQKGYIYRGLRPILWCPTDRTALAENTAEIEYQEKRSPSIYVRFSLREDPKGLLPPAEDALRRWTVIWTTTPWTIPANVAVAFHPNFDYALVRVGHDEYLLAMELVETVAQVVGWEDHQIVASFKGQEIEGMSFQHPLFERPSLAVLAEYVTLEEGTGVVHTAPGHGREDFLTGQKYGLPVLCPVDEGGRFTQEAGPFAGLDLKAGDKAIIEALRESGHLLFAGTILHSYPHCWRCHNPVIFRTTEQWFMNVDHTDLRQRALKAIQEVEWFPKDAINRISAMVSGRPDWCLSRQRAWGVAIPAVYCERCHQALLDPQIIEKVAQRTAEHSSDAWYDLPVEDFLPENYQCPQCGGTQFRKEEDVLDVWFDSGSTCRVVLETHPDLRFPADVYLEGHDQHRGWFNSSLMVAMATRDQAPYRQVLTHGFMVDERGRKQSKSLGNVTNPLDIINRYGADVLRLAVSSFDYFEDMSLTEEAVKRVADVYRRLRNTFRFLLGNLQDFDPQEDQVPYHQLYEIDRWALHRLQQVVQKVTQSFERYEFHPVYMGVHHFCAVDLSSFYLDVLKDRLYASGSKDLGRRSAQTVLWELSLTLSRLVAPILVHTAEEVWQHLRRRDPRLEESVHLADFPSIRSEWLDAELEQRWEILLDLRDEVNKALESAKNEKRIGQPLEAMVTVKAPSALYQKIKDYENQLASIFIVSQARLVENSGEEKVQIEVAPAEGTKCARCWLVLPSVGQISGYPDLCARCAEILERKVAA